MHWQHVQDPPATADALPLLIPQPCKRCSRNRLRWQKQDAKKVCDLRLPVHSQGGKTVEMPLTRPHALGVPPASLGSGGAMFDPSAGPASECPQGPCKQHPSRERLRMGH